MRNVILIILLATAAFAQTATEKPDSIKGDTVYVHTVQIDDGRVSIEREAYDEAIKAIKSIHTYQNVFIIVLIALLGIGGILGWRQLAGYKSKLENYQAESEKARGELQEIKKGFDEQCKEIEVKRKELDTTAIKLKS